MILNMSKHSWLPSERSKAYGPFSWTWVGLWLSCHDRWNGNEAVVTTKERPKKVMKFLSFYQNIHFCSADSPEAAVLWESLETKLHLSQQWPPDLWMRIPPEGSNLSQQALPSWSSRNWNADKLILQCLVQIPQPWTHEKWKVTGLTHWVLR